ncbi:MAG: hypothetical protein R2727_12070 [Bacteroidales bacterium]
MTDSKIDIFRSLFSKTDRVMVAYSGGVDSTLLLCLLSRETEADVMAVTIKTPIYLNGNWKRPGHSANRLALSTSRLTCPFLNQS